MTRSRKALGRIGSAVVAAALLLGASVAPCSAEFDGNPVIFVHGGFGSAGQFESQAMRFSSNGYPDSHLAALEYDSLFGLQSMDDVLSGLDDLIAELQASTGAAQVDLMGHSLGTAVSQMYLSTPARAASVAHYVNIDGGEADAPPGGVETLAIWAGTRVPAGEVDRGTIDVLLSLPVSRTAVVSAEAEDDHVRNSKARCAAGSPCRTPCSDSAASRAHGSP